MKTMHHFCDNCLNYYSKWTAHLGWSLLSDSEKRQLLSFIYFIPSVQHRALLLRPPKSVVRLHLVSGGPCARQQSACVGWWPLCSSLSHLHCSSAPAWGSPCQIFLMWPVKTGSPSIHPSFYLGTMKQCIGNMAGWWWCVFLGYLMLWGEAALPPKPQGWGAVGALLGDWSRLCTPHFSAEQPASFLFFKFLPVIGQRGKAGLRVGIQVPISSSSSHPCGGKSGLHWVTVSEDHNYYEKLRHCLFICLICFTSIRKKFLPHFCEATGVLVFK